MAPISVVHVINGGIGVGGAERMLSRIVHCADRSRFRHSVVTILPCEHLEAEMRSAGATFISLGVAEGARPAPRVLTALPKLLRLPPANLFVGWLNYGGVLASLLGSARGVPVVLNFRSTPTPADLRRPVMRALRVLAPRAATRLANSHTAQSCLEAAGFGRVGFIANGFSSDEFCRDRDRGLAFRAAHGIPCDAFLFGHVARFHPVKNQAGLLRAAEVVLGTAPQAHMVFVGRAVPSALQPLLQTTGSSGRVHLLEGVDEPQEVYSALDAYVHNSDFEGFPNVIAEAMLHELPIVCSDAGESRVIVGEDNLVVPPRRDDLLAAAMSEVLGMSAAARATLGAANRERVSSLYSAERVVAKFEALLSTAVGDL